MPHGADGGVPDLRGRLPVARDQHNNNGIMNNGIMNDTDYDNIIHDTIKYNNGIMDRNNNNSIMNNNYRSARSTSCSTRPGCRPRALI